MDKYKEKIHSVGLFGVYLYGISLITSKGGVNIGLALMTISSLFFIKNLKFKSIEKEYKILLIILLLTPIFDALSPGGFKSASTSIKQMYRILPVFIAPIFLTSKKRIENFMYMISGSVLINCIYGLYVYKLKNWNFSARYESLTNYMDSPHALVGLSFVILMLIVKEIKLANYKRLFYLAPLYTLNMICIILSQTRGAWLSLITGLLIFGILALSRKNLIILTILGTMSFLTVGDSIKENRYIKRFQSIKDINDPSPKIRLLMWEASVEIYKEHKIFGVGKNNSPKYYLEYFERNNSYSEIPSWARKMMKDIAGAGASHNMYFENLVNAGILSFGLVGFWLYMLFRAFKSTVKEDFKSVERVVYLGILCMLICYYVTGLTEASWGNFIKRHIYLIAIILYVSNKRVKLN
ncbi:MAG: O-antigen ligase family protein [Cetobacterium sp.]